MRNNKLLFVTLLFFALVLLIWIASPYIIKIFILPISSIQEQNAGNIYTAVSALFSALAFSALLVTIFMQKKQLDHQQKELLKIENSNNISIKLQAYTALLNYYNKYSYDPNSCELSAKDVAKRINLIIKASDESLNK